MIYLKAALDIVKTMMCSIIDYGNIFIDTCTSQDLQDLQILQNSALRIDKGSRATSHVFRYSIGTINSTVTIHIPYER